MSFFPERKCLLLFYDPLYLAQLLTHNCTQHTSTQHTSLVLGGTGEAKTYSRVLSDS